MKPFRALLVGLLLALLVVAGCTAPTAPTLCLAMVAPVNGPGMGYVDEELGLTFAFIPVYTQMQFTATNNSQEMVKLIWDNTAFVDLDGKASRVIHIGIKYMEKEKPMAPSLIPPETTLDEIMVPSNRIYWTGSSWYEAPLVRNPDSAIGRIIGFVMCFEKNGKQKYINFKFAITQPQQSTSVKSGQEGDTDACKPTPIIPAFSLPNANDYEGILEK